MKFFEFPSKFRFDVNEWVINRIVRVSELSEFRVSMGAWHQAWHPIMHLRTQIVEELNGLQTSREIETYHLDIHLV